jgi:hypothetical protein
VLLLIDLLPVQIVIAQACGMVEWMDVLEVECLDDEL